MVEYIADFRESHEWNGQPFRNLWRKIVDCKFKQYQ